MYEDFRRIELADGIPQRKEVCYQYILEIDNRIIGFVSGLTEPKWFYLTDLWIEEPRRGDGLGTKLLVMMEEKAKSVGMEHVYLWTTGPRNSRFYEKNGYERFAVLEDKMKVKGYHQIG